MQDNFIPKQYSTELVGFRVEKERLEQIDKAAAKFNVSRSAFIKQCIEFALAHMEEQTQNGE